MSFSFLLLLTISSSASSKHFDLNEYLTRFGYFDTGGNEEGAAVSIMDTRGALRDFQRAYRLHTSGQLDAATLFLMKQNRCGVKDKGPHRYRRSLMAKWQKTELTYFIVSYPPLITKSAVDHSLQRAFREWEDVSILKFYPAKTENEADIVIGFPSVWQHDSKCSYKFAQDVLAHAFPPSHGQVHFNLEHHWDQEAHLIKIATHELGHALGLGHTLNNKSIMYAYDFIESVDITSQEINDLSEAYVKTNYNKHDDYNDDESDHPDGLLDICGGRGFDAVIRRRGEYQFFKGSWMWRISRDTKTLIGSHHISAMYGNSERDRIDAAIEVEDDAYFFHGSQVFVQRHIGQDIRLMRLTDLGLKPSNRITAAFSLTISSGVTKYILIDGNEQKFYYFDAHTRRVHSHSHRIGVHFMGVPVNAEAVFAYGEEQHETVFLKDGMAHIVDSKTRLMSGHPKSFSSLFPACRHFSLKDRGRGSRHNSMRDSSTNYTSSLILRILAITILTILIL